MVSLSFCFAMPVCSHCLTWNINASDILKALMTPQTNAEGWQKQGFLQPSYVMQITQPNIHSLC